MTEISYGDLTFYDTHPGVIAAMGALVGLQPPPVETSRVLELGCGTGFNLLAIALSLPQARVTGVDISEAHVQRAREAARAAGVTNAEFQCLSIDDFPAAENSFDYVIAHGVYSWVPEATRDAILAIAARSIAPNGLAYISYNINPGWRLRILVRDTLRYFEGASIPDARARVNALAAALPNPDSAYSRALRSELANLDGAPDYYIAHEHLVPFLTPVFFEEFVNHAAAHGLQFAVESRLDSNLFARPDATQTHIEEAAGGGYIRREQYLDLLLGRYFRRSILCRDGLPINRDIDPLSLLDRNFTLTVTPTASTPESLQVRSAWGDNLTVTDPVDIELLHQWTSAGPIPVSAQWLAGIVRKELDLDGAGEAADPLVASVLWNGAREGLWSIRDHIPPVVNVVSSHPIANPLARLQAPDAAECTNCLHRRIILTPAQQHIVPLLDGSRTAAAIAGEMQCEPAEAEKVIIQLAGLGFLIA